MNTESLLDFINYYKNSENKLPVNPILNSLDRFLQNNYIPHGAEDEDILKNFLPFLESDNPEAYIKLADLKKLGLKTPTQLWELLCLSGEPEAISYLIKEKIITKDTKNPYDEMNALHLMALVGSAPGMEKAITEFGFDSKAKAKGGANILHLSAGSGDVGAMQLSIDQGIDPHSKTIINVNALHLAASSGNVSAIQMMADKKFGIDLQEKDTNGNSVFKYAQLSGNATAMQEVIKLGVDASGQKWFINILRDMGYKGNARGMCFGVAQMAMQAALAGEMDKFNARFKLIQQYIGKHEELKKQIDEVMKTAAENKNRPLTESQQALLDVKAFFEGIELYQLAFQEHKEIFGNTKYDSQDLAAIALLPILTPAKLEKDNGRIEHALYFKTHYQENNITEFLRKLKNQCKSKVFPVSINLSKANYEHGHEININYDPKEKIWTLIDANKPLSVMKFAFNDIDALQKEISKSLDLVKDQKNKPSYFFANVYVHNDNHKIADIKKFKDGLKNAFEPENKKMPSKNKPEATDKVQQSSSSKIIFKAMFKNIGHLFKKKDELLSKLDKYNKSDRNNMLKLAHEVVEKYNTDPKFKKSVDADLQKGLKSKVLAFFKSDQEAAGYLGIIKDNNSDLAKKTSSYELRIRPEKVGEMLLLKLNNCHSNERVGLAQHIVDMYNRDPKFKELVNADLKEPDSQVSNFYKSDPKAAGILYQDTNIRNEIPKEVVLRSRIELPAPERDERVNHVSPSRR